MPTDINPSDTNGVKWVKLQAWLKQACENAGIHGDGSDPLLTDINTGDTEGVKWAKLQRWMKLLAEGIGGSSSGAVTEITASRDATVSDAGAFLYGTSADTTFVLTLQSGTFAVGAEFRLAQLGAQALQVAAGDGVTFVQGAGPLGTGGLGTYLVIKQVTLNNWNVTGVGVQTSIPNGYLLNYAAEVLPVDGVVTITAGQTLGSNNILINLTADVTSIVNSGAFPYGGFGPTGWRGTITFVQDGTGGHSVTFPETWKFPGGVAPRVDKRPSAVTVIDVQVINWSKDVTASARNPQHRQEMIEVTASRDLALADADSYLYSSSGSSIALTIQADTIPVGAEVDVFQAGSGQVSLAAGTGVTIISKGSNLKLSAQGSAATLKHVTANTWHLVGDLTA